MRRPASLLGGCVTKGFLAVLVALAAAGCAGASIDRVRLAEASPSRFDRHLDGVLTNFRQMLLVLEPQIYQQDLVVEIEPIRNAAIKDLPGDLTPLVRRAFDRIGGPFRTVRTMV